jgi:hypothetical protein
LHEIFLHRPQHLAHHGRKGAGVQPASQPLVGQQVVAHDHVVAHAQSVQEQGSGKAGAVLAGGAVEHQRRVMRASRWANSCGKARRVAAHKAAVGVLHQRHHIRRGQVRTSGQQVLQLLHDGGLDGQRVHDGIGNGAGVPYSPAPARRAGPAPAR